ncbi:methyltransferase domain-containing protein [Colletotrichum musicola]|uniref:Methyltransferase domain-containing protein n=1 Tax=Colletotrichum musicola TaxID=2175873 RepID=A0A8H6JD25_9PEZI|nr:methyltransferase domain-containing protein [Colletotrichum musicola]
MGDTQTSRTPLGADQPHDAATTNTQPAIVPDHVVVVEVDDDDNASDISARSVHSSTTSVTSSIFEYRVENGRTYHGYKEGKYNLPNDDKETDRLDLQHNLFLLTFNDQLGTAPINTNGASIGRVLDVGTGTGIWAIDFGEEHPEAEVRGIDLSAIQPEFTPPNVWFEIDDLEEPWEYSKPFDYIHSRMMNSSIGNWKEYIKNCFDNLAPGGYLELNEMDLVPLSDDGTLKSDSKIIKAVTLLQEALVKIGRQFQVISDLKTVMIEQGFTDVTLQKFKWPLNPWPKEWRHKELGIWNNQNLNDGLEAVYLAPYTRILGWTKEEVLVFMAEVRKEMNDMSIHAYMPIWSVYGKKPEQEPEDAAGGQ